LVRRFAGLTCDSRFRFAAFIGALTIRSLAAKKPVVECSHRDGDVRCPPNARALPAALSSRQRRLVHALVRPIQG